MAPTALAFALAAAALTADEKAVLELTNRERKAAGLAALKANPTLIRLAREHSATMARLNELGHDLGGTTFVGRIKASKYPYRRVGENVGQGYRTPKAAVEGWMDSEPHKENLLNKEFTQLGVAVVKAADGTRYWTQVFGTPLKE